MPTLFLNARNVSAVLAAAVMTSLVFVSAAVGPLPLA